MSVDYRLIPMIKPETEPSEPLHVTEHSDFMLISYLEKVTADFYDAETNDLLDTQDLVILTAVLHWLDVPVRYHLVVAIDEEADMSTLHTFDDAILHSQIIHKAFEDYIIGEDSDFPKYRALGWLLVPANAGLDIKLQEERDYNYAQQNGDHDYDLTVMFAELDGILIDLDETPLETDIDTEVKLSKSVSDFLDMLENRED